MLPAGDLTLRGGLNGRLSYSCILRRLWFLAAQVFLAARDVKTFVGYRDAVSAQVIGRVFVRLCRRDGRSFESRARLAESFHYNGGRANLVALREGPHIVAAVIAIGRFGLPIEDAAAVCIFRRTP